jgi:hypothetical protein
MRMKDAVEALLALREDWIQQDNGDRGFIENERDPPGTEEQPEDIHQLEDHQLEKDQLEKDQLEKDQLEKDQPEDRERTIAGLALLGYRHAEPNDIRVMLYPENSFKGAFKEHVVVFDPSDPSTHCFQLPLWGSTPAPTRPGGIDVLLRDGSGATKTTTLFTFNERFRPSAKGVYAATWSVRESTEEKRVWLRSVRIQRHADDDAGLLRLFKSEDVREHEPTREYVRLGDLYVVENIQPRDPAADDRVWAAAVGAWEKSRPGKRFGYWRKDGSVNPPLKRQRHK